MARISYDILVELKNTDLHALSAFEAITEMMQIKSLQRLKRYRLLSVILEAESLEDGHAKVEKLVQNSFLLLNPNKERYTICATGQSTQPEAVGRGQHLISVDVKSHHPLDWSGTLTSLTHKTNIQIHQLTAHIVWELLVADDRPRDVVRHDLTEKVVNTTSRKNGLLANPLYEDVTVR